MWLCVDRMEASSVILVSDEKKTYRIDTSDYARLTGRIPMESDVLRAEVAADRVLSAAYDETETAARKAAARARLARLFGKA